MKAVSKAVTMLSFVGLSIAGCAANAQANLTTVGCQAQLDTVASEWNAIGLPAPPAGPLGGIQAKGGMVKLNNGHVTSVANFQYMTIQLHQATNACRAGDDGTAMRKVAMVRDRLDSMSR